MSNDRLDNIFKQQITDAGFEPSEALWQRLDNQLQPLRNQRDKKRRVAAIWFLLLLLGGGALTWGVLNNKKDTTTEKLTQQSKGVVTPPGTPAPGNQSPANTDNNTSATQNAGNNSKENTTAGSEPFVTVTSPATTPTVSTIVKEKNVSGSTAGYTASRAKQKRSRSKITAAKKGMVPQFAEAVPVEDNNEAEKTTEAKVPEVRVADPAKEPAAPVAQPKIPVPGNVIKQAPPVTTAKKPGNKKQQSPVEYIVTAGANFSSPFRKPGVFAGVLLRKTIDEKHLFAGLKISTNTLNHQFTSAAKINQFPVVTDAVIERLTTLQLPFGYEFGLNGKTGKPATTFLTLGFEPSYIAGLRTVFYDDNGIPGGPRTPVVNSPLLAKAINRFNVSFIAGVRLQAGKRAGLSLGAGYNLINMTDKQYYNRTATSNNLRYVQAGLQWRLHK
jgi:hypothetical protein